MWCVALIIIVLCSGTRFQVHASSDILASNTPRNSSVSNCPLGYFACKSDSEVCLAQIQICDGQKDCPWPDTSDEEHCHNVHDDLFWNSYYPPRPDKDAEDDETCNYNVSGSFFEMSKGTSLINVIASSSSSSSSANEMESSVGNTDDAEWVLVTEDGCFCNREKLSCQNLHMENLSVIPPSVEYLDLSGSIVETLDFNANPGFPSLQHLILSYCEVSKIENGSFYRLTVLETLYLTGNLLSEISNGTFSTNKYLQELHLGYNRISRLDALSFYGLESLNELDLRNNHLSGLEANVFIPLKSLKILYLNHNAINVVKSAYFNGLQQLEILSLSDNKIATIEAPAFSTLTQLKFLYLPWNKIRHLKNDTFAHQHILLDLRLNNNKLRQIESGVFGNLINLKLLNLQKNDFRELPNPRHLFQNMTKLQHVYFDFYWMCWWIPHARLCEPKGDGISSVENLLDNGMLRICVWLMGLIAVVGNLFVIISRLVLREPNRTHSYYIKNLAAADLLMGLFLLSIAVHDMKYRGEFLSRQYSWRHSIACQLSGFLCTLSSEASVLILSLITLDRYLSIARPFAEKSFMTSFASAFGLTMSLWFISFTLSFVPLTQLFDSYFRNEFYTTNGLCLPLQIHNPFDHGWEYSFTLFVVVNSIAFVFICFAYWQMLRIIRSSSLTLRTNQQKQDGLLAKRFGLVVLTDFLSWAPIITTKLIAMSGVDIQLDLYAWLAVFALPINSALNPIIYTLTTKMFLQQFSKFALGFPNPFKRSGQLDDSSISMSLFHRSRTQRRTMTSNRTSLKSYETGSRKGRNTTNYHVTNERRIRGTERI